MYVCIYISLCTYISSIIYIHTHIHTYIHTHIYIYHTHTYIYIYRGQRVDRVAEQRPHQVVVVDARRARHHKAKVAARAHLAPRQLRQRHGAPRFGALNPPCFRKEAPTTHFPAEGAQARDGLAEDEQLQGASTPRRLWQRTLKRRDGRPAHPPPSVCRCRRRGEHGIANQLLEVAAVAPHHPITPAPAGVARDGEHPRSISQISCILYFSELGPGKPPRPVAKLSELTVCCEGRLACTCTKAAVDHREAAQPSAARFGEVDQDKLMRREHREVVRDIHAGTRRRTLVRRKADKCAAQTNVRSRDLDADGCLARLSVSFQRRQLERVWL